MLLTLSVSFGKNIQPFMFVTFISDKGGRFLRLNKLQGAIEWRRKEKRQLRKELLLKEKGKLLLRKIKKQLREEKDNQFFLYKNLVYFFFFLINRDLRSQINGVLRPVFLLLSH